MQLNDEGHCLHHPGWRERDEHGFWFVPVGSSLFLKVPACPHAPLPQVKLCSLTAGSAELL